MRRLLTTVLSLLFLSSCSTPSSRDTIRVASSTHPNSVHLIPLEKYIAQVLAQEVPALWPHEALKAQAVASRTYALYRKAHPRHESYDVLSDTSDQVFEKKFFVPETILQAVKETRGEVLLYQGEILPAFFHSCCGGMSESSARVWKDVSPLPPLTTLRPDPYCALCPRKDWTYSMSREELTKQCKAKGYNLGDDWNFSLKEDPESKRVLEVSLGEITLPASTFREIVGATKLRSTLFEIENPKADPLVFHGHGSGHGVGLCQWGAKGMADQGKNYREILEFYYPGSVRGG